MGFQSSFLSWCVTTYSTMRGGLLIYLGSLARLLWDLVGVIVLPWSLSEGLAWETAWLLLPRAIIIPVQGLLHTSDRAVHSTQFTVHCSLYTLHFTLYTLHCTTYTLHCTLYTVNCQIMFYLGYRFITSLLRRLQEQTLLDEAPPMGKIHPFS